MEHRDFSGEIIYTASRSSGPGGQNVNKVNTRVELRFPVVSSQLLTDPEKTMLAERLSNRINAAGELVLSSQSERSQLKNREKVTERFYALLQKALTPRKRRKRTAPTAASREERLETKRRQSEKKDRRRPNSGQ